MASPVRLTITARDEEEAQRMLAAVARVRVGEPVAPAVDEVLVTAHSEPPLGHSYRELRNARLTGLLEATLTKKGLVFTRQALEAYRARRSQRPARAEAPPVVDLTERRIRSLEAKGIAARRK